MNQCRHHYVILASWNYFERFNSLKFGKFVPKMKISRKFPARKNEPKYGRKWPKLAKDWKLTHFGREFDSDSFWTFSLTFIYGKTNHGKLIQNFFLKFSFSWSSYRPFYWKTYPFEFCDLNHIWYVIFGLYEFSGKTV